MSESSQRKLPLKLAGGVVALASLTGSVDAASAHNFGSDTTGDGIFTADSYSQHYSFHGYFPSSERAEVNAVMASWSNSTDLLVQPAPNNQVWGANLWRWDDGNAYNWYGMTLCRTDAAVYGSPHHTTCSVKNIKFNNSVMVTALGPVYHPWQNLTPGQRKYISAHEFGHLVGLRHSNPSEHNPLQPGDQYYGVTDTGVHLVNDHPDPTASVMHGGSGPNGSLNLHQHDLDHVNAHY